jgi:hypothetical protein
MHFHIVKMYKDKEVKNVKNFFFSAVTVTVFKYRNKIGKIVVKAVPYSVT